ncbi:MAG TPA: hypothetical protein PK646_01765 [Bacillota bacterium]|mgnify:CR=1 FL=1|jgi:hypothetical protein|nr:hypothetical protein [Fastidiosipila sp.]HPX92990.1 hypothetical protein [Bacillota bacterium]HQB80804.1 hypothetical protein [Bacillota bacterium]
MMILYFLAGLLASAAMILALLIILVVSLRTNWNHANRFRISFMVPVLLAAAIAYFCVTEFVPRVFDLVHLAGRHYDLADIDLQHSALGRSSLISDGVSYYFLPGTFDKNARGRFQVMFTPGTRFIIHVTYLEDSAEK